MDTTNNQPSRRTFIKTSALATGGLLTAPMSMDAMVHGFGEKKLKLALVGCGGRGSGAAVQA
ncbi:MAG: twin-arginine translocation signal domain-containing protein, partial [Flavobacteriaceae bacterium]